MKHLHEIEQNYCENAKNKTTRKIEKLFSDSVESNVNNHIEGKQCGMIFWTHVIPSDNSNQEKERKNTRASRAAESRSAKCRKQIDVFGNVCCMYRSSVNVWVDGNCKQFEHTQKTRRNKKLKKATTKK